MNADQKLKVLNMIRSEYLDMPGLTLFVDQVQRLCGVDRSVCQEVLSKLVAQGFLANRPDGSYARARDGDLARLRPARAQRASESTRRTPRTFKFTA